MGIGRRQLRGAVAALVLTSASAWGSTITQNSSWTINRSGTSTVYRITAYGDSIYAGYNGSLNRVGRRAAPWVDGEYLSEAWNADIEVIRRTKSGALAGDIYNNKIVNERSYMQTASTRVVTFEMCGNDFLQARSQFAGQSGTCSQTGANNALANCTNFQQQAINYINANDGPNVRLKVISNLYYPGYNADNALSNCTDPVTGQRVNKRDNSLPVLAKSNWRACNYALQNGFVCADSFAAFMGADYDSNNDGQIDSVALRFIPGESEADYVQRITVTLKSTIRDSNTKLISSTASADYLQSDDTHPTFFGTATISLPLFGGTGSGSGAPDFSGSQIVGGKNPQWNMRGHERMGYEASVSNPATP